ncbi:MULTISPECIES: DNA polymerase ligase N-terminal domain-containing protein [unclassified Saccharopolyspora]|uniref:DNA polymerase ligase N-terminal domain-containing protein n=1 Tax=unclassified Saccharopolyspora TaxID=2646250 RepID=UPI001CD2A66E|nr:MULTISPECIES: DNA polymerase ligase N-terminal domain-containing protein [unclassified Saccharopolyspora]MCA1188233.1 DNA ligase [Saccharopolyspora sp. 6T]MCA1227934.1 DNA ligase [Saccharopolyspora sp. 6M]MCA1280469.1 DNA ligase [Saccharopolyspora sp. 7B]
MARDGLGEYRSKRDLARSGEPGGGAPGELPRFVVQRHDASTVHFDFRLEVGDVLKSWAVPKGPSTDPRQKRLATPTEDHPLDYASFEGTIPEGYGAGTVVVWDTGSYRNLTEHRGKPVEMADALERGHVKVLLEGSKLTGAFALTRTPMRGREEWLLVKVDDEGADRRRNPARTQPESVLSGRTNADLAAERENGR